MILRHNNEKNVPDLTTLHYLSLFFFIFSDTERPGGALQRAGNRHRHQAVLPDGPGRGRDQPEAPGRAHHCGPLLRQSCQKGSLRNL